MNDVKNPWTVDESVLQNLFGHFKESGTRPKDKPRSRKLSIVEDEVLFEMVDKQPSTSTYTLSAELDPSQTTINWHLQKLNLVEQTLKYLKNEIRNSLKYSKTFTSPKNI